jgi:hypothetical protein
MRRRWLILIAIVPAYMALLAWVMTLCVLLMIVDATDRSDVIEFMFSPGKWELNNPVILLGIGIPVTLLVITQIAFLLPVMRVRFPAGGRARSLRVSLVSAGFVAALLTAGLLAGVYTFSQILVSTANGRPGDPLDVEVLDEAVVATALGITLIMSWVVWSLVLMAFARRRVGSGVLSRTIGYILGGTLIEVGLVLPIDIMIRRRTNCYCGSGTFWALCVAGWALLWLSGPGIVVAIASRRRHPWWDLHCESCGYQKGPKPSDKCPECGHAWEVKSR